MPEDTEIGPPPSGLIKYIASNEKSLAWVWRAVSALVCFALTSHFLSKEDYNRDQMERAKDDKALAVTITQLNGTLVRWETMGKTLDDHEARLRELEKGSRSRP